MPPEPVVMPTSSEPVREERARLVRERVAPRQRAAGRVARERAEAAALVVEVERERPLGVEEVRLDEPEQEQLRRLDICACSASVSAAAEQVVLRDLRLRDEVLDRRETRADLERAGRALGEPRR